MDFSADIEMRRLSREAQEFFEKILFDEAPIFVSDEATIWDVSTSTGDELLDRCSKYYGKPVSIDDLKQPLWKLLQRLNAAK